MYFGIPQIIFTIWLLLGLGMHLAKDGEPRTDRYSFFTALISVGIELILLYCGGFYG